MSPKSADDEPPQLGPSASQVGLPGALDGAAVETPKTARSSVPRSVGSTRALGASGSAAAATSSTSAGTAGGGSAARACLAGSRGETPPRPRAPSSKEAAERSLEAPTLRGPDEVCWQWEHRTGFKNYDERAVQRIEEAYQRGHSRVRLKTGKMDDTPMELFFVDMIQFDPKTGNTRKIRRVGKNTLGQRTRRKVREWVRVLETGRPQRVVFAQYEKRLQDIYRGMGQRDYNVCDLYHESGCCTSVARSSWFFVGSMIGVLFNAAWIGIDVDLNTDDLDPSILPVFTVIDHVFCTFFLSEVLVRFGAFKRKRSCVKDGWFIFDALLSMLMVGETWLLPLLLLDGDIQRFVGGTSVRGLSVLRTARLIRLTRLGRIARLLRAVPEVLTLLKGIAAAMRSVFFTLLLLVLLLYVFGVWFKVQSEVNPELAAIFPNVPTSMWVLLFGGTFLDNCTDVVNQIGTSSPALAGLFLLFIFVSCFMVMNMLTGILVDVVQQVARSEKEESAVGYLKSTLLEILECHDKDGDGHIHRSEFQLLMRNPEMHLILRRFGVNVVDLISLEEVLFEHKDLAEWEGSPWSSSDDQDRGSRPQKKLSFAEFLEVVLRLRGGNSATVMDIVDLREYVRHRLDHLDLRLQWGGGEPAPGDSPLQRTPGSSAAPSPTPATLHGRSARRRWSEPSREPPCRTHSGDVHDVGPAAPATLLPVPPRRHRAAVHESVEARLEELLRRHQRLEEQQTSLQKEVVEGRSALFEELRRLREDLQASRQVPESWPTTPPADTSCGSSVAVVRESAIN